MQSKPKHLGYKVCYVRRHSDPTYRDHQSCWSRPVIVELEIMGQHNEGRAGLDAMYPTAKHRCNLARVLRILDPLSGKKYKVAQSSYDPTFFYQVGQIVSPDDWESDLNICCGGGLHYYTSLPAAMSHDFNLCGDRQRLRRYHFTGQVYNRNLLYSYQNGHLVHKHRQSTR